MSSGLLRSLFFSPGIKLALKSVFISPGLKTIALIFVRVISFFQVSTRVSRPNFEILYAAQNGFIFYYIAIAYENSIGLI